ncbi:MAG: hypothetical protein JXR05_17495, partial [Flavobacteriaceae bacterium]
FSFLWKTIYYESFGLVSNSNSFLIISIRKYHSCSKANKIHFKSTLERYRSPLPNKINRGLNIFVIAISIHPNGRYLFDLILNTANIIAIQIHSTAV